MSERKATPQASPYAASDRATASRPVRNGLILSAAIALTAVLSHLATICQGCDMRPQPTLVAALVTLLATLPPLFFGRLLSNGAANQLAIIAWRIAIMLPAVAIATRYAAAERKTYLIGLLACYFVSLLLESWLLIRDVRRTQASDS